jgi:ABC-type phosphate transport system substrate-binding protein
MLLWTIVVSSLRSNFGLQHFWAELSEKLSDVVDGAIKYGGGNQEIVSVLANMSEAILYVEMGFKTKDINRLTIELQLFSELLGRLQDVLGELEGRQDGISN